MPHDRSVLIDPLRELLTQQRYGKLRRWRRDHMVLEWLDSL
jgi:hypothetical protein